MRAESSPYASTDGVTDMHLCLGAARDCDIVTVDRPAPRDVYNHRMNRSGHAVSRFQAYVRADNCFPSLSDPDRYRAQSSLKTIVGARLRTFARTATSPQASHRMR